jgi:hypothetical protein
MKKLIFLFVAGTMFTVSCSKNDTPNQETGDDSFAPAELGRHCYSQDHLEEQMKADPTLRTKMEAVEEFTARTLNNPESARLLSTGVMEIPVVVNVLYRTAAENISDAQIASQIAVLNEDFAATNADYSKVPAIFLGVRAGNTNIKFVLQSTIRKATTKTSWTTNDAMKKSSQGGINPTSPTTTLNLWACTMSGGILGYAQFPGGAAATDGVVILNTAFGRTGTAAAPFNKGRTATHEVGHYLNLRHIWGDATCGSDLVGDTPAHTGANYGCPAAGVRSSCSGTPVMMTMNYMDYTDDVCMYMFSAGQKSRMNATYAVGGPRASLR